MPETSTPEVCAELAALLANAGPRQTEAVCPPWCTGHNELYQPWEQLVHHPARERSHAGPNIGVPGKVSVQCTRLETSPGVLAAPMVEVYADSDAGVELTEREILHLTRSLLEAAVAVRSVVSR